MNLSKSETERLDKGLFVAVVSLILALGIKGKVTDIIAAMDRLAVRQIANPSSIGWFDYFAVDVLLPVAMVAYIGVVGYALWWGVHPWLELFVKKFEQR